MKHFTVHQKVKTMNKLANAFSYAWDFAAVLLDELRPSTRAWNKYYSEQRKIMEKWHDALLRSNHEFNQQVANKTFDGAISSVTSPAAHARIKLERALELLDLTIRYRSLCIERGYTPEERFAQQHYDEERATAESALRSAAELGLPAEDYLDKYSWGYQLQSHE